MKARGTWMGGSHILLEDRRGHQVTVDLPHGEGGGDLGTSAVELTVLSLAGSILTVFAQVAKKRRLAFQSLRVDLDADQPEKAPSVAAVEGVLHVVTSAPPEDVASALGFTLLTCPAGVLFEQARIPVRVHSEVHPAHRVDPAARPHPAGEPRPGAKHLGDSPPHAHGGHMERRAWGRAEAVEVLESPERRGAHDPDGLWAWVHVAPGATVVDVGAGTGFFALPAARRVGPSGHVYAVDLSPELVEFLDERRREESLPQLVPVQSTIAAIPLESAIADIVLLANVLHDLPPPSVAEAVRLLKPDGRLVNVDWKKYESPGGPPLEIRLTPEEAVQRFRDLGLEEVERWEPGPWHYASLFRRTARKASNRGATIRDEPVSSPQPPPG